MVSCTTNGRKFEVFYDMGGHCGPFHTLASALRHAVRSIYGSHTINKCVIRDRALPSHAPAVAIVEGDLHEIMLAILDETGRNVFKARKVPQNVHLGYDGLSAREHAGFAASLVGSTWKSNGGRPVGNDYYVAQSRGDKVQVVNLHNSHRYWWNYRSIVAVAGMERVS